MTHRPTISRAASSSLAACLAGAALAIAAGCSASDTGSMSTATADTTVGADSNLAQDVAVPDVKNQAWVYATDPVTDDKPAQVTLPAPTDPSGFLTGEFVQVSNCLAEEGGAEMKQGNFTFGHLCHEVQVAAPNANGDGSYLDIVPPEDTSDMNDPFAEVQMYYHVNQIHDFFANGFDLHDLDFPLYALVNVTYASVMSGGQFEGFPNAAFMPKEAFAQFGLPERDSGAIVFGQYQSTDFCYDASVIYHEYTHAMVGTTRLVGATLDVYGMDNLPAAMNEGFADYFSCSKRNSPIIGTYALTFGGDWLVRDLTQARKCPDDLTTEVHADGKIIGSAMWELRGVLGQELADAIILKALQQFSQQTNMDAAAKLIVAEAKKVDAETGTATQTVLKNHGMIGCVRAKEWTAFSAEASPDKIGYSVTSPEAMGGGAASAFPSGLPGYVQFWIEPPAAGKVALLGVSAQGGGGMFGGGEVMLNFAVRKGKPVQLNMLTGGAPLSDAALSPKLAAKGPYSQQFALTGNCLAAGSKTYVMMLNNSKNEAKIQTMDVQWLDAVPAGITAVDCAK
ncbi:MAG: M36 family metallopeptidase [Deltaproteobacteria bacterium]|nr:M36 family metallopeptidase [Deltaproteobacteria bacterium]